MENFSNTEVNDEWDSGYKPPSFNENTIEERLLIAYYFLEEYVREAAIPILNSSKSRDNILKLMLT